MIFEYQVYMLSKLVINITTFQGLIYLRGIYRRAVYSGAHPLVICQRWDIFYQHIWWWDRLQGKMHSWLSLTIFLLSEYKKFQLKFKLVLLIPFFCTFLIQHHPVSLEKKKFIYWTKCQVWILCNKKLISNVLFI